MKTLLTIILAIFSPVIAHADTFNGTQAYNYIYQNITNDTTTNVKATPAFLHTVTINKPVASSVIILSDSNSGVSGPTIATITIPSTLLAQGPYTATYDVTTVNGLTVYTQTAASDVTIAWK